MSGGWAERRRGFLPKTKIEKGAFFFMMIVVPVATMWDLTMLAPVYFPGPEWTVSAIGHFALEAFLSINIVGNLLMAIKKEVNHSAGNCTFGSMAPKADWKYCAECNANCPPRSHHCKHCNVCTLKRDHHCSFIGTCVGFNSHRYFLMAMLYLWLGAIYAIYYQVEYLYENFGAISMFYLSAPHFALMLGLINVIQFVTLAILMILIMTIVLVGVILFRQLSAIIQGQTQYEHKHNIRTYDLGWKMNLKSVFGNRWYLAWIAPFITSPLPGDGMEYDKVSELEDLKSM